MINFIAILILLNLSISQEINDIDSSKVKNPNVAWKLAFIPGLGQIYNEKYIKAIGFIGAEYFVISRFNKYKIEGSIGKRNTYAWWAFGIFIWNILDAYVDSHLSTFPLRNLSSNQSVDTLKVK